MWESLNLVLKQIYPEPVYCFCCEKELKSSELEVGICHKCFNLIHLFSGLGLQEVKELDEQYFDLVYGVALYEEKLKEFIYRFKYYNQRELVFPLVEMMAAQYSILFPKEKWDGLIPVAMHKERLLERGYNHAFLLAQGLSVYLNIPCCDWVIRIKKTLPQNKLTLLKRRKNLKGAFFLKDGVNVKDKNWLIIDDIFTTGATANEIARILKEAGGRRIGVYALASGRMM